MQVSKTPDCRDAIWRRQGHITSARETKLYVAYHQHREMWKFSRGKGAHRCLGREANLSFRVNMPQNVLLGRCLVDNRGSDLRRFARKCVRERETSDICFAQADTYQCRHRDPRPSLRREGSHLDRSRILGLSRVPRTDAPIPTSGDGRRDSRGRIGVELA